jgi:hypothetical protein
MTTTISEDKLLRALITRLSKHMEENLSAQDLVDMASLSDIELTHSLFKQMLEKQSHTPPRTMRKLKKRADAERAFFEHLESSGGTLKAKDVADILGVSRQTVNNRLKSKKLLAVQRGSNYIYPAFQFKDNDILPYFEQINQSIKDSVEDVERVSFFTCAMNDGSDTRSPIDILSQDHISDDELNRIKRSAALLHSQAAK